ncbi:hypothetical protein [Microbulbifer sp. A4B17]|uniref:hypothetical protein n=1 Tax=Microbulbifer sp. A4B17 TaxID=359370 RepID=UPI001300B2F1|nr:hypothetical protein [Microbulbifer sp. A4B17]
MLAEKWRCCHFSAVSQYNPRGNIPADVLRLHRPPGSVAVHPRIALDRRFGTSAQATNVGVTGMGQ